jgi:hypothetical protein
LKKTIHWYENALKHIKGEVKHREVTEKLQSAQDAFDLENQSKFHNFVKDAHDSNQIAAK